MHDISLDYRIVFVCSCAYMYALCWYLPVLVIVI